jgi:hypothetical protein
VLTKNKLLFRFDSCLTLQNSFFFSFDIAFLLYRFRFFSLYFLFLLYRFRRFFSLDFVFLLYRFRFISLDFVFLLYRFRFISFSYFTDFVGFCFRFVSFRFFSFLSLPVPLYDNRNSARNIFKKQSSFPVGFYHSLYLKKWINWTWRPQYWNGSNVRKKIYICNI